MLKSNMMMLGICPSWLRRRQWKSEAEARRQRQNGTEAGLPEHVAPLWRSSRPAKLPKAKHLRRSLLVARNYQTGFIFFFCNRLTVSKVPSLPWPATFRLGTASIYAHSVSKQVRVPARQAEKGYLRQPDSPRPDASPRAPTSETKQG